MYIANYRIFIVETYIRERTYAKCREISIRKYPDSPVRTKSCVSKLIKKWRTIGSVFDEPRRIKKTVLTDEKLEDIPARLQISPRTSLRRLSQETCVSVGSASKVTKLIKFRSYIGLHLCMSLNLLMGHKGFGFVTAALRSFLVFCTLFITTF
jgi:hypothetical protein